MRKIQVLLSLSIFLLLGSAPLPAQVVTGPTKVYVFLHEDCLISQHYTLRLRKLHQEYASETILFEGIFPNSSSTELGLEVFRQKYGVPFPMWLDEGQKLKEKFDAKVTPEVVVVNNGKTLYQGRIDDTYFRVGKKRRVTTTSELKDVLEAIRAGQAVTTPSVPAVGCFITDLGK